jgi:stage V sporulation protein D (sporulation-specific penicillin-binding protein)
MLTLVCILVALVIVGRLYLLQIVQGSAYTERASAQFSNPDTPLPDRGTIYFTARDGTLVTAATMKQGYSLALNPSVITDVAALYAAIGTSTQLSYPDFLAKATKTDTHYEPVATHIEGDPSTLISQQLPGLIVSDDRWRYYPGDSLAAQEIGFVAYDNNNTQQGQYGLEKQYNATLTRTDDLYGNFFVQLFGGVTSVLSGAPQQGDLVTTIEPTVQAELERDLVSYDAQWHPQIAGGIIMNPQNGEIIAMAASPTFDLNNFGAETNPSIYNNFMVNDVYEMGSIMKPLTMAAGIDSGAITATTTYDDTGCITVDKSQICNFDFKGRGVIPMQIILNDSLNVGASFIATRMGTTTMRDYFLNHYDLGKTTGIDMPGEQTGLVNNLSAAQQVDYDTAAFGQGIAVTPVTMIRALAVLANGGYLVTPHLVRAIDYDSGITQTLNWPKSGPVLKPQTVNTVTQMLTTVVDVAFAKGMSFPNYSVAAKTGTAQIANPAGGGYYPNEYVHSYFGYFPASNPKFIIFLFGFDPVGAPYSSETWGTYFHSLVQFLINYYQIPPDR